jgi:ubiquinone/menaquinone biosynthesis C-methylase UbiE
MLEINRLNLGCGRDIRSGWINLDCAKLPGVDVVHDLAVLPLPFEDNTFDKILCMDVLEHLDYIPVLRDIHRILKPNGIVEIRVPHFTSASNYSDPTHKKMFSISTLLYFAKQHGREYYFDFYFSSVERNQISFNKSLIHFYNYIIGPLINSSNRFQEYYERSPLRVFPAVNVETTLVK